MYPPMIREAREMVANRLAGFFLPSAVSDNNPRHLTSANRHFN